MLYRARYVLPMVSDPIFNGAVRVEGEKIVAIGPIESLPPLPGEEVWEHEDAVLLPGLINAHCHLELGLARGALQPGMGFSSWVKKLREHLQTATETDYLQAARLGALEALRYGTTTLVDIGNTGQTFAAVADLPLRVYGLIEVLGLNPEFAEERMQNAYRLLETTPNGPLLKKGLTPHAAYSVSTRLLKALMNASTRMAMPYSVHVAESREEQLLFAEGTGALQSFCEQIYPQAPRYQGKSALTVLAEADALPFGACLVHGNTLDEMEIRLLASRQGFVVHCPQSHDFFGHPAFPLQALRRQGIPICLGTDSLASGHSLSLFDAMAQVQLQHPELSAKEILGMTTLNAAQALGRKNELGCLAAGGAADLIAVRLPFSGESQDIEHEVVCESQEVLLVVVAGQIAIG